MTASNNSPNNLVNSLQPHVLLMLPDSCTCCLQHTQQQFACAPAHVAQQGTCFYKLQVLRNEGRRARLSLCSSVRITEQDKDRARADEQAVTHDLCVDLRMRSSFTIYRLFEQPPDP